MAKKLRKTNETAAVDNKSPNNLITTLLVILPFLFAYSAITIFDPHEAGVHSKSLFSLLFVGVCMCFFWRRLPSSKAKTFISVLFTTGSWATMFGVLVSIAAPYLHLPIDPDFIVQQLATGLGLFTSAFFALLWTKAHTKMERWKIATSVSGALLASSAVLFLGYKSSVLKPASDNIVSVDDIPSSEHPTSTHDTHPQNNSSEHHSEPWQEIGLLEQNLFASLVRQKPKTDIEATYAFAHAQGTVSIRPDGIVGQTMPGNFAIIGGKGYELKEWHLHLNQEKVSPVFHFVLQNHEGEINITSVDLKIGKSFFGFAEFIEEVGVSRIQKYSFAKIFKQIDSFTHYDLADQSLAVTLTKINKPISMSAAELIELKALLNADEEKEEEEAHLQSH